MKIDQGSSSEAIVFTLWPEPITAMIMCVTFLIALVLYFRHQMTVKED